MKKILLFSFLLCLSFAARAQYSIQIINNTGDDIDFELDGYTMFCVPMTGCPTAIITGHICAYSSTAYWPCSGAPPPNGPVFAKVYEGDASCATYQTVEDPLSTCSLFPTTATIVPSGGCNYAVHCSGANSGTSYNVSFTTSTTLQSVYWAGGAGYFDFDLTIY